MKPHDQQLWAFAAKELELGEHRFVESHLEDCPECREQVAAIQVAKEVLESAREVQPTVNWALVDEKIGAMVEKRLRATARRPLYFKLSLGGGLAFAAVAALMFITTREKPLIPEALPPAPIASAPESWARVDRAQGLTLVNGDGEIQEGMELRGGDVLRTAANGRAFVHLPDQSHMKVGAQSQVTLTRSQADDVALTLERGSVAVRASHLPRKGFVVHAGGVSVFVVGTVFGVENTADAVEISVTEGKVRVEMPNGDTTFVEPGQRLRFDTRTENLKHLKVTPDEKRELNEVAEVADATASAEQRALVPAAGGVASSPPMVAASGTPRTLPRISANDARSRQVTLPESLKTQEPVVTREVIAPEAVASADEFAPMPQPVQIQVQPAPAPKKTTVAQVTIAAPVDVWPTLGGDVVRGVPPPRDETPPAEDEWAAMPAPPSAAKLPNDDEVEAPAPAPAPAVKLTIGGGGAPPKALVMNLEAQFLQRADAALSKGDCDKFIPGLEDIAQDEQRSLLTEQARILKARCFDSQLRPRQAMGEYAKYLSEYPAGRFINEAHTAVGN